MASMLAGRTINRPASVGPRLLPKRRWRRFASAAAAGVLSLGMVNGADAVTVKTVPKPTSVSAFATLDLPEPVSHITSAGADRITYRTAHNKRVGVVVADLATGRVVWQGLEYLNRSLGVVMGAPAYVKATDSIVTIAPNTGATRNTYPINIVSRDAKTGNILWTIPSPLLSDFPDVCGANVCVEVAESDQFTIVVIDPITGKRTNHRKGYQRTVGGDSNGNLLTLDRTALSSAIASTTNWRGRVEWDLPLPDIFKDANVDPDYGYGAKRLDDGGWIVWLGSPSAPDQTLLPSGFVAGISPKGLSRWLAEWRPCAGLGGLAVKCDGPVMMNAGKPTRVVSRFELVDPISGRTRFTAVLKKPIDTADTQSRALWLDRYRLVISDPPKAIGIDTKSQRFFTPDRVPVGWCEAAFNRQLLYYDASGQIEDSVMPRFSRPCRLGDTNLSLSEAAQLFESKKLRSDLGETAGRYVAWVADKKIVAVQVSK